MPSRQRHPFLCRDGLTLAFLAMIAGSPMDHVLEEWRVSIGEALRHGRPEPSLLGYMYSDEFLSSPVENWESEFLQMGLFVLLTVWLRQRGASESRPRDEEDEGRPHTVPFDARPWPARGGGLWLRQHEHSLSAVLFLCFALSFVLHFCNSWRHHSQGPLENGEPVAPMVEFLAGAHFRFEAFQNWQSEFLSVVALCLFSIYLREKGSPQSKNVQARHSDTGA